MVYIAHGVAIEDGNIVISFDRHLNNDLFHIRLITRYPSCYYQNSSDYFLRHIAGFLFLRYEYNIFRYNGFVFDHNVVLILSVAQQSKVDIWVVI